MTIHIKFQKEYLFVSTNFEIDSFEVIDVFQKVSKQEGGKPEPELFEIC